MKKSYLLLLLTCFYVPVFGAAYFWIGGTSGNWNSVSNWSGTSGGTAGVSVPGANDDVTFDNGLTVAVTYDAASNSIGFKSFKIINNTQLTLTNSVSATRTFGINSTGSTYYTIVATGSSLTLKNNANTVFEFSPTSGWCVFDGDIFCVNQAVNTSNGPRLNSSNDSIIINKTLYTGPQISQTGSSMTGSKWRFGASSVYQIDRNGGTTLAAKYASTALIKVTGTTTTPPTFGAGFGTQYGSIEINTSIATSTLNLSFGSGASVQGYLKITNSNGQIIRLASTPPNPFSVGGDVIVNAGTLQVSNSATAIVVNAGGNLQVDAGATFDLQGSSGDNTINVSGNLVAPGTITLAGTSTASKIVLNSSVAQQALTFGTISGPISLQLNNTSGNGFTLNSNLTMPANATSKLTLTSGVISNTGGYTIYLQNTAATALAGGTSTAYLNGGKFRRDIASGAAAGTVYFFPSGKLGNFRPVKLFPTNITTGANSFITEYFKGAYPTLTVTNALYNTTGREYWDINRFSGNTDAFDVSLLTDNTVSSGFTTAQIPAVEVGHYNSGTSSWDNLSNNAANALYSVNGAEINTTGNTSFSPFTFMSQSVVLPIAINYFTGIKQNGAHVLNWKLSCTNTANVSLIIERGADNRNFAPINTITASSVRCLQPFDYTDNNPVSGYNYYRLKMTDDNGKTTYSGVIVLLNKETGFDIINLSPSVVSSHAILNMSAAQKMQLNIEVTDVTGRQVQKSVYNLIAGSNQVQMDFSNLAAGAYQITGISADGKAKVIRFVKQ